MYYKCTDSLYVIEGAKAKSFLHGQVSQSIEDMTEGQARYALFLNQKGKVQTDLYVYIKEGLVYFSVPKKFEELFVSHLKKLAPLSQCSLKVLESLQIIHCLDEAPDVNAPAFQTNRLGQVGFDVWLEPLNELQGVELSEEQVEFIRIKNGVAKVGVDVTEQNLPQEARLDRALHFKKGCYLGQEVIARLHFRGHVNKKLFVFELDHNNPPIEQNDSLLVDDQEVGQVTSVARENNKQVFLAYVKKNNFESQFKIKDQTVRILKGNE